MAHNMVDRDACRESNTTLKVLALLAGESLLDFLLNHVINGAVEMSAPGTQSSTAFARQAKRKRD